MLADEPDVRTGSDPAGGSANVAGGAGRALGSELALDHPAGLADPPQTRPRRLRVPRGTEEGAMRRFRGLLTGGMLGALVLTGAAPAHGADTRGTLAIVNGIPGSKIDVCLDG